MKAAWIAPFVLALATTPALASDTGNNAQQQSQTQGSVSPNAINPGQGKQPDGHSTGGENQKHTDDFSASKTANADTDIGSESGNDQDTNTDDGASAEGASSADSSASADHDTQNDTGT
ncbi:hypothetical protein [Kushneria phyllosphaerae]|uniref:Uncharacterized protein n=1 Tax=Kushneria phyllosphaerae TaxID=2100822 RepID=A0A2R8CLU8_9GAMM|nr:hypothetical protein [Kushneria phyllosphaerae]SPJ33877.1 hypothetical protein KSP9073_01901 [Kushneria phyllosphaerae]